MTVVDSADQLAFSPERQPERRPGEVRPADTPDLRVYSAEERALRSQRRRARTLLAFSACILAISLMVVAAANIIVTSRQFHLDALSSSISSATSQNQDLQLQRAELEAPQRIISIAEHRLGMIMPKSVTYLPAQPLPSAQAAKAAEPAKAGTAGAGHRAGGQGHSAHTGGRAPAR